MVKYWLPPLPINYIEDVMEPWSLYIECMLLATTGNRQIFSTAWLLLMTACYSNLLFHTISLLIHLGIHSLRSGGYLCL